MSGQPQDQDLPEELDNRGEEIIDYIGKNSPRPSVDTDLAERLLAEAAPARAAEELQKMVDGFHSGSGAATGRRSMPAAGEPPTDDLETE